MEGNLFSGSLPSSLGALTSLGMYLPVCQCATACVLVLYLRIALYSSEILSLGHNRFNGAIPDVFQGLPNLSEFIVTNLYFFSARETPE
jgi:hypothetical protein